MRLNKNKLKIGEGYRARRSNRKIYILGMAEALVLDKLQKNWKDEMFNKDFSLEKKIEQLTN